MIMQQRRSDQMRFFLAIAVVVLAPFAWLSPSVVAEEAFQDCITVQDRAEIRYDRRLIVNVSQLTHPERICRFYVYSPPTQSLAGDIFFALKTGEMRLVLDPIIRNASNDTELQQAITEAVEENVDEISDCFFQVLTDENFDYSWHSDILECKGDADLQALIFTAEIGGLSSATIYFSGD